MKKFTFFNGIVALMLLSMNAQAQTYQLVWSDEFNTSIGPDWTFETGAGVNNEKQYYQSANASVSNGNLLITARKQSVGGLPYTSARMNTAGKRAFKYGKIESRIIVPKGQGLWPAFWMLGSNISDPTVGWPKCGEIDIMEQVNTDNNNYGTIHWDNNGHVSYGGNTPTTANVYHTFSITWDASAITWFVDGVQYHQANIANGINSTDEFQNPFFIILNLAVAGDWPGQTVDENRLPATMTVDYVRVYQLGTSSGCTGSFATIPGTIQAENFCQMTGIQTETTTDAGGGQNVGYIDANDWMGYRINVPSSGTYTVQYRVASANGGGSIRFEKLGGGATYGTIAVPSTGGWQTWTTISQTVQLTAGQQDVALTAVSGGFNINWFSLNPIGGSFSTTIQAESYSAMSGIQTENCSEGGLNVGWVDANDWLAYNSVTIPSAGTYRVLYRVASPNSSKTLRLEKDAGATQLGTVTIPNTGGWQTWQTVAHNVTLPAGTYTLGIATATGGFNINYFTITNNLSARLSTDGDLITNEENENELTVFPNPSLGSVTINVSKPSHIDIIDATGNSYLNTHVEKSITVNHMNAGLYIVKMKNQERTTVKKLVVK